MANIWFDAIPCCCKNPDCKHQVVAVPDPATGAVIVIAHDEKGRQCRIPLAPGWAQLLAAHLDIAANQVKPIKVRSEKNRSNEILGITSRPGNSAGARARPQYSVGPSAGRLPRVSQSRRSHGNGN